MIFLVECIEYTLEAMTVVLMCVDQHLFMHFIVAPPHSVIEN